MSILLLYMPFKILNLLVSDRRRQRVKLDSEGEKCAVMGQGEKKFGRKDKSPKCMKPEQLHKPHRFLFFFGTCVLGQEHRSRDLETA